MSQVEMRRAERKKAKLRLGISAPSGAGKTLGSLILAYGILREAYTTKTDDEIWEKILLIDTEEGSGELYVGTEKHGIRIGAYNYIRISAPFEVRKYLDAIRAGESGGMEVIIKDSISHAWNAAGGILDKHGKITDASTSKNSYMAWRFVTPEHNAFIDAMLQSPAHIIATMRSKVEYVQEKDDNGRTVVRKIGMAPVQREGMEYEFTTVFDINFDSICYATKDRTDLFSVVDGAGRLEKKRFMITPDTGKILYRWLNTGVEPPKPLNLEELAAQMSNDVIACIKKDDLLSCVKKYSPLLERMQRENILYHQDMTKVLDKKIIELPKNPNQKGNNFMALIDVDMTGVKASGEYQELGEGQYIVCIRDTEKMAAKDKFDANNMPLPSNGKNFYLKFGLQVEGGPNHDHIENERLNLWNENQTAVNIARSQLKAIQDAIGIYSNDSTHYHGRYMVLNVKKDNRGQLKHHYEKVPQSILATLPQQVTQYVPPTASYAPQQPVTATQASQTQVNAVPAAAVAAQDPNALPAWARR